MTDPSLLAIVTAVVVGLRLVRDVYHYERMKVPANCDKNVAPALTREARGSSLM